MSGHERGGTSPNLVAAPSRVGPGERLALLGHDGAVLWFTGLSGSGKSTVAQALEHHLMARGVLAVILDGDNVRMGLNRDLGFSESDREENLRRIAEVSKLIRQTGAICITAFISPLRRSRERAREIIGPGFLEIHLSTPLDVCEGRDVKGFYQRARAGEIPNFTGIDSPFEPPESPDLVLDTSRLALEESVQRLEDLLESRGIIPARLPE